MAWYWLPLPYTCVLLSLLPTSYVTSSHQKQHIFRLLLLLPLLPLIFHSTMEDAVSKLVLIFIPVITCLASRLHQFLWPRGSFLGYAHRRAGTCRVTERHTRIFDPLNQSRV